MSTGGRWWGRSRGVQIGEKGVGDDKGLKIGGKGDERQGARDQRETEEKGDGKVSIKVMGSDNQYSSHCLPR